uniref:C-type lectin domain-containing protein n=1 Tax=Takifugu rubripes TaxID=31033 RepID=A0A674P1E4_TAKRU
MAHGTFWGLFFFSSYWGSGEPNGGKGENCGDIKNFNAEKSWNDESCSLSLLWICEKKRCPVPPCCSASA